LPLTRTPSTTPNRAHRQRQREQLTEEILQQVQDAIREELDDAPESVSRQDREAIEETVLAHTRHIVEALSFDEMQSEGALLSHIANARFDTYRLVRERRPQSGAGAGREAGAITSATKPSATRFDQPAN